LDIANEDFHFKPHQPNNFFYFSNRRKARLVKVDKSPFLKYKKKVQKHKVCNKPNSVINSKINKVVNVYKSNYIQKRFILKLKKASHKLFRIKIRKLSGSPSTLKKPSNLPLHIATKDVTRVRKHVRVTKFNRKVK